MRGDAGLGLVPLPPLRPLAQGAGGEPGDEGHAEEDEHGLSHPPDRQAQADGGQAEPAGQHLEVEVAEEGEGDDLEQRVDGHEDRGGFPVAAGEVVPDEDHGDAAGQADDDEPGPIGGLVR